MKVKSGVLYITYDGLLDTLGASQILPYIKGIAKTQGGMVVLSFEKPSRFAQGQHEMINDLKKHEISWKPLRFTSGFGALGKLWDVICMYFWALMLARKHEVRFVHTRGHSPAQAGLFVKRLLGPRLIFDCRGLWVDERVDKGGWDMSRRMHRLQYRYFKSVERTLFTRADRVVVLTHKVVDEVVRLGALPRSKITVIPCCADFDHFPLATPSRRAKARDKIVIPRDALVLGYLGSVGRMYMLESFFRLFQQAAEKRSDCHALVITQDVKELYEVMAGCLSQDSHSRVHVISANRKEVPEVLPAMDILVSFIQPSYARMAASPTKMAECFAEGIPVICNAGVGDVVRHIEELQAGIIVDPTSEADLLAAVMQLDRLCHKGGQTLRDISRPLLGLEHAERQYLSVYNSL
ncbi:glycosyltransferase family 4 protein [Candidatus Roizmanbacteria bacterium]|nr:glycosyltransferase family 4 protein [Candidatus Roizmanbacteria bacterium]